MKKKGCICENCLYTKLHNINLMKNNVPVNSSNMQDNDVSNQPMQFTFVLLRHIGLFVLGIVVGMGIVLQKPMDIETKNNMDALKKQNDDLKNILNNINSGLDNQIKDLNENSIPTIKNSIQIK